MLFLCAAHFAFSAFARYDSGRKALDNLAMRTRFFRQQQAQMAQKKPILDQISGFIQSARDRGLNEEQWATYEVNLQGPFTFPELEEILGQCANTDDYYFKSTDLEIRNLTFTAEPYGGETIQPEAPDEMLDANQARGDVLLTLKGAFVARRDGK